MKRQNPVAYYLLTFVYVFLMLLLRVVMLLPLTSLFYFPSDSPLRFLALLTPLILIFIVLPLRFSMADALMDEDRYFRLGTALSLSNYGKKLGSSIVHGLKILLWGIPTYAVVGYLFYLYNYEQLGKMFGFIKNVGKSGVAIFYSVTNFARGLFHVEVQAVPTNTLAEGMIITLVVIGICLLIWLLGAVLCSGHRYLWALSEQNGTTVHTEHRRHIMGRRWAQLGNSLVNLLLMIPFFAVFILILRDLFSEFFKQGLLNVMMQLMSQKSLSIALSNVELNLLFLVLAFVLLYLAILPIRRIRTSLFVRRKCRKEKK